MLVAAAQLRGPDYAILGAYFLLMLGIGAYFYRHARGMKDYFSGGNRVPWWLSGVSFYMSSFSVFAFVLYSGLAFQYGWVAVTIWWTVVPATLASVLLLSRKWRRARVDSPVEYLELRYGPVMRQLFTWHGLPVRIIDDAMKLVTIGFFISSGLGLDMKPTMIGSGLIMLLYTLMGGLWAVIVTDCVQFIIMLAAVLILLPLAISRAGGVHGFVQNAPEGFFQWTTAEYGWIYVASTMLLVGLVFCGIQWSLIQRFYCVPREKDALKVGWLVVGLYLVTAPILFVPAMAGRLFLTGIDDGSQVYARLCVELLPTGLLGLTIAAIFAATMSTLSSDYNACAGVLTNDVYRRLLRPDASQRELVFVGRVMTLLVGLIALGISLTMADLGGEELFRTMMKLFSVTTAPVAIPMMLGLITRRVTNAGALSGFIGGILVGLVLFFECADEVTLSGIVFKKENVLLFYTTLVTFTVTALISMTVARSAAERENAEAFATRLATPVGESHLDDAEGRAGGARFVFPIRVIGASTLLIGAMMVSVSAFVSGQLAFALNLGLGVVLVVLGVLMASRRA